MPDIICLPLPDGSEFCVRIPILVNPDPFPPQEVEGPVPDPWIVAGIRPEITNDLRAIATVRSVVALMSPEVGRSIQAGLEEAVRGMTQRLPQSVSLRTSSS